MTVLGEVSCYYFQNILRIARNKRLLGGLRKKTHQQLQSPAVKTRLCCLIFRHTFRIFIFAMKIYCPPTIPTFITAHKKAFNQTTVHHRLWEDIASLTRFKRLRSNSCPAAIERAQVVEPDNMWLPPHYQNYIAATLGREQPSNLLRFPGNGVVLLGDLLFLSTLKAEEEPTMSASEPYNWNHGG